MALRAWSVQRIALLWLLGIAFYGVLALLAQSQRRATDAEFRAKYGLPPGDVHPIADSLTPGRRDSLLHSLTPGRRDSLLALIYALWRDAHHASPEHRDSILHRLDVVARDTTQAREPLESLYRALDVPAKLSPSQLDSLRAIADSVFGAALAPALRALGNAMNDAAPWLVLALAIFIAPAAALLGTTVTWLFLRRRAALGTSTPAA